MMAAAVSEAMRPQTTVDKIVTAARESHLIFSRRREGKYWQELEWRYDPNISFLDQALDIAREIRDVFKIREPLYNLLEWGHLFSEATHTLVVALSMFVAADGDLEKAIVGAVMYGRDMDSYASVVGALAGAFNGAESIKKDWVRTVVNANPEPDMPQLAEKISRIVVRDEQELRQDLDDLYHLI
jgi:ADP-ribosylglycohydrolase